MQTTNLTNFHAATNSTGDCFHLGHFLYCSDVLFFCTRARAHTHTHTHIYIYICVCMCVCACVCM